MDLKTKNQTIKTLLFHNGDYNMQKPLKFADLIKMKASKIAEVFLTHNYRQNTGMLLMSDSLAKNINAQWIPSNYDFKNTNAEAVVTNVLHCISPNHYWDRNYWDNILKTGIKIVPISLGFRYDNNGQISLSRDMIYTLSAIAERNEIGVRGEFAKDVLNKHGIKNVRIIGCPSVFYHMNPAFQINNPEKQIKKLNFNFNLNFLELCETHKNFIEIHTKIFHYFHNLFKQNNIDIAYTMQTQFFKEISGYNYFIKYNLIKDFLIKSGCYYFSVNDWIKGLKNVDFSIGTQIHGNIAAILAGVPALPICVDKRMEEMAMHHKIPHIKLKDFDSTKPLQYYYDMCDYSEFNKIYKQNFDNFVDYCLKNGVALKNNSF
ncbi:MAG: polysaccharide pyruvyl transferase family protein [Candidatus Gastranaerophilales bacterium]|nr:polysaccharide pyruvyl transferase family protein [Candidatus Gastranaerophilales bacterium]